MRILTSTILSLALLTGAAAPLAAEDTAAKTGPMYTLTMEGMT